MKIVSIDSFCDNEGAAVIKGKLWRWEFGHFVGVTFVTPNTRKVMINQVPPDEVWAAFYRWYEKVIGPLPDGHAFGDRLGAITKNGN